MKVKRKVVLALVGLIAVLVGCVGNPQESNLDLVQAVFDTLSTPEMRGRRVGTAENVTAGEYIAQVFSQIGLTPLLGDSFACPYEQAVFDVESADPRLTAHLADGSFRELILGSEFVFNLRHAPVDLTLDVTYDPSDPALAEKIYVDQAMQGTPQTSGAVFDIYPGESGSISAQGTEGERREISIEKAVLQQLLEAGLNAFSVLCRDTKTMSIQNNYIGVIRGQDSTKAVIVGAHFDGAGGDGDTYSAGAIDNASGVAVMLGMAQLLREGEKPPIDVVVCAFNGEEGSRRYGSEAVARDLVWLYEGCYYINVDCVGLVGGEPYQYRGSRDRELEEAFAAALQTAGYAISDDFIGGDWTPFEAAGVPAVSLAQETLGVRHTTADRPEAIDIRALQGLAVFLVDFVRSNGDNIFAQESGSSLLDREKAAAAQRQRLVDSLGLGFHDSYMYQFAGHYVCISGNRPVHTAKELRNVYPWIDVRETIGPFQLQEVLAVDSQANRPFEMQDQEIARSFGPDGARKPMPLDQVVRTVPGALDECYFVYQDSTGRRFGLSVSRLFSEGSWASLSRNCLPLASPAGAEIADLYYLPWGDSEVVGLVRYYPGGDFFVEITEYDPSRPIDDPNHYGNYTCSIKPLSRQDAVEMVEQFGLTGLEDYFASLLCGPDGD